MAKATVTCTCCECGKSFAASKILASRDQANNWEEWAKSNIIECDECKEKARQAEREEANKKAAESAKEFELPELTGSEKQVAWANTIRVGYYTEYSKVVDGYTKLTKEQQAKCNEEFEQLFYSNDWSFATRSQAEDRVHRIGQESEVHIYDICAEYTLDVRILDCLSNKENLVNRFKKDVEKIKNKQDLKRWINLKEGSSDAKQNL